MKYLQLFGVIFTIILGTLLHFTYAWSGKSDVVSLFSATNESTWEHLKLLAIPMLLFGIAEYLVYGRYLNNFIPVRALSILLGMSVIIVVFYTYVGIAGQHFLWADIGVFVLGVILAYWFSGYFLTANYFSSPLASFLGWVVLIAIALSFAFFTSHPPQIGLFLDPVSRRYGR